MNVHVQIISKTTVSRDWKLKIADCEKRWVGEADEREKKNTAHVHSSPECTCEIEIYAIWGSV